MLDYGEDGLGFRAEVVVGVEDKVLTAPEWESVHRKAGEVSVVLVLARRDRPGLLTLELLDGVRIQAARTSVLQPCRTDPLRASCCQLPWWDYRAHRTWRHHWLGSCRTRSSYKDRRG